MMNKFFSHVKLVAQYYICQWNGKFVNKLYIVSNQESILRGTGRQTKFIAKMDIVLEFVQDEYLLYVNLCLF